MRPPRFSVVLLDLISAGFSREEVLDMSLKQIYYWWESVLLRSGRDRALQMKAMSMSSASGFGSKEANRDMNRIIRDALKKV